MTLFNPYKIVTALLISCLVSITLCSAIPWYKVQYNESLCTCSAGTGSSFNYADWFNQNLNTTDSVLFTSIDLNNTNHWNYTAFHAYSGDEYDFSVIDFFLHTIRLLNENDNTGDLQGIELKNGLIDIYNYANWEGTEIYLFNNSITITGDTSFLDLTGIGNAYACLNENGTLYRSGTACV